MPNVYPYYKKPRRFEPMPEKFKGVVNVQVSINRAVWAYNVDNNDSEFKDAAERDAYIKKCLQEAKKDIDNILKRKL